MGDTRSNLSEARTHKPGGDQTPRNGTDKERDGNVMYGGEEKVKKNPAKGNPGE